MSILEQTYQNFELIIIDDGSSTNKPCQLVERFAKHDRRIRYFWQKNQGLASARNTGAKLAKGSILTFADDDDISLPERFAQQINYLEQEKLLANICQVNLINKTGKITRMPKISNQRFTRLSSPTDPPVGATLMITRKQFYHHGGYRRQLKFTEDLDLGLRLQATGPCGRIEEPLYHVRRHDTNISYSPKTWDDWRMTHYLAWRREQHETHALTEKDEHIGMDEVIKNFHQIPCDIQYQSIRIARGIARQLLRQKRAKELVELLSKLRSQFRQALDKKVIKMLKKLSWQMMFWAVWHGKPFYFHVNRKHIKPGQN